MSGGSLKAPGKLTGCEQDLAINLRSCFRLFLLSFIRKTKNARLKNPTDFLHKNVMKPLRVRCKSLFSSGTVIHGHHILFTQLLHQKEEVRILLF